MAIVRSSPSPARAAGAPSSNGSASAVPNEREQLLASVTLASAGNKEAIRFLRDHAEKNVLAHLQGNEFKARLLNTIKATNIALGSPEALADELVGFAVQELKTTDHYMLLVAPPENVGGAVLKLAGMGIPVCRDAGQGFLSVRIAKTGEIQVAGIPQIPAYRRMVRQIACKMIGWKPGDKAPDIDVHVWRAQDKFSYKVENGKPNLVHEVNLRPDRAQENEIEGAYGVIALPKQTPFVVVMTMDKILTLLGQTAPAPASKEAPANAAGGAGAPAGKEEKKQAAPEEPSGKKRFYARVPEKEWTNAVMRVLCREWMGNRAVLNPEASLLAGALLREESVHEHEQATGDRVSIRPAPISLLVGARAAAGPAMLGGAGEAAPAPQPSAPAATAAAEVPGTAAPAAAPTPDTAAPAAGGGALAPSDETATAPANVSTPAVAAPSATDAPANGEAAPPPADATAKANRGRRPDAKGPDDPVVFSLRQPAAGGPRL